MSSSAIPIEILQANRLKIKRKVAAVLINAMAETGTSYDAMDAKIGRKFGFSRRYIQKLIDGTTNDLNEISDIATAMDCELHFQAQRRLPDESQKDTSK